MNMWNLKTLFLQVWLNLMELTIITWWPYFLWEWLIRWSWRKQNMSPFDSTLFQFLLCVFGWRFCLRRCFSVINCRIHLIFQSLDYKGKRTLLGPVVPNQELQQRLINIIMETLNYVKHFEKVKVNLKIKRNLKIKISTWKLYVSVINKYREIQT